MTSRVVVGDLGSLLEQLLPVLRRARPDIQFVPVPMDQPDPLNDEVRSRVADAEVVLAATAYLPNFARAMPRLKWAHSTWAGVDSLFHPQPLFSTAPSWQLTRSAGYMGRLMAEYVVSQIVNWKRQNRDIQNAQAQKKWIQHEIAVNYEGPISNYTILIVGLGDIGTEVAKSCGHFGMRVLGVGRRQRTAKPDCVQQFGTFDQLPELLSAADFVCSILPRTTATNGLFSNQMLKNCAKKKSVFMNVGRGNVVKNEEIVDALEQGWLGGAILDVVEVEPLPEHSKLWLHPKVVITPHVSALSVPSETANIFLDNLTRYENNQPLKFAIDWTQQY